MFLRAIGKSLIISQFDDYWACVARCRVSFCGACGICLGPGGCLLFSLVYFCF